VYAQSASVQRQGEKAKAHGQAAATQKGCDAPPRLKQECTTAGVWIFLLRFEICQETGSEFMLKYTALARELVAGHAQANDFEFNSPQ
jgi:hypothetical protein